MATSNWTSLGAPGTISANPSIGKNDDGRLEAFVWTVGVDAAKDLWHIWQTAPNSTWSNWASLGRPSTGFILEGSPIVVQNEDGRLEVFATGPDYALLHIWQVAPNGSWSNWNSLGKPTNEGISPPFSVHVNDDGRLEAFAIGSDNALWHIWQVVPNGGWSTWASLGRPSGIGGISMPVVSQNQDGRLEAFVIGSDQALWHIWQVSPNGTWGTWFSSGGPQHSNSAIYHPFVRKNDDGRLEVFVMIETVDEPFGTNATATLWHIWQTAPNGTWSNWASLGRPTTGSLSAPSVRKNKDGRLEVFTIGSDGELWHIWQLTSGGAWGNWGTLGTPSSSVNALGDPFVAENDDGRLETFSVGSDDALWHTWQVSPGGHWDS